MAPGRDSQGVLREREMVGWSTPLFTSPLANCKGVAYIIEWAHKRERERERECIKLVGSRGKKLHWISLRRFETNEYHRIPSLGQGLVSFSNYKPTVFQSPGEAVAALGGTRATGEESRYNPGVCLAGP